jgi:hypothetical protein
LAFPADYGGFQMPDIVANLRVDQAWGSAQIMGALHQVNMIYFGNGVTDPTTGHADDKLGFVVGAGLKLNAPMIGQGDYLQAQINYTQGALRYIFQTPNTNWDKVEGANLGFGMLSDAVVGGTIGQNTITDLELTTAWNVNAAYEHFWNPRWRTSLYGGYAAVSYNDAGNALVCVGTGGGNGSTASPIAIATPGCDMNWQTWWIGSRTQWNVTKDFYMGVDVLYSKLNSASTFNGLTTGTNLNPAGLGFGIPTKVSDMDNLQFRFRVHRDFYP